MRGAAVSALRGREGQGFDMQGKVWRYSFVLLAALGAISAPQRAHAFSSPLVESSEAMMGYQGALLHTLGTVLPPDSEVTLAFDSSVDGNLKTFSFSLVGGQSYRGVALTMTGSGAYNAGLGQWDLVSFASAGGGSWTSAGSVAFTGDSEGSMFFDSFFDVFVELNLHTTTVEDVTYDESAIRTVSTGTVVTDKGQLGERRQAAHDVYNLQGPDAGKWTWTVDDAQVGKPVVHTTSAGSSPTGGGSGSFSTTLQPVPEPCSAVAVVGGLRGMVWRRLRRG